MARSTRRPNPLLRPLMGARRFAALCDARAARLEALFLNDYISVAEARLSGLQTDRDFAGPSPALDADIRRWEEHLASLLLDQAEVLDEAETQQAIANGMVPAR